MDNKMKRELLNEVVTGLLIAATFAACIPADAFAQLTSTVGKVQTNVAAPFMSVVNILAYGIGGVLCVAGIAGAKKHADNPGSNPLGPALGKLGAGAAFLAAPTVVGMMASTGSAVFSGTASFTNNGFGF